MNPSTRQWPALAIGHMRSGKEQADVAGRTAQHPGALGATCRIVQAIADPGKRLTRPLGSYPKPQLLRA
jgi:hypothetical protein